MEFRSMQYFVTTARCCNFTKAARELFISQPALSQSIRRLEDELGVELFRRGGNMVTLTHAGKVFLQEAERILAAAEVLTSRMAELAYDRVEKLQFGISTFYSRYFLPEIIRTAETYCPQLRVNCLEDISLRLEEMVCGGILHCALVPSPLSHTELYAIPVRTERILLALPPSHPLAARYPPEVPVPLSVLAAEPFIFLKRTQRFAAMGMQLCADAGFVPHIVYETMNWETLDTLVAHGIGAGFVPDLMTNRTDSCAYRMLDTAPSREYLLIRQTEAVDSPAILDFYNRLCACLGRIPQ